MWNDNDTTIDLLGFGYLVHSIEKIIRNDDLIPSTIGIFGDWGSGKSSLMRMVETRLEDEDILVLKFNGWLFEGYDDAKSILLTNIVQGVIKERTITEKAKKLATKLLKQIDWMKLAKSAVLHGGAYLATGGLGNLALLASGSTNPFDKEGNGLASNPSYEKLVESLSNSSKEADDEKPTLKGIKEFHDDFKDLVKETNLKKVVVFIDDLDRCTSDTIISLLEAIKLFLYVENTVFVISADERLIDYAVRKRFPELPSENKQVGRDYLEKLIQFPIRIPQLNDTEIEAYMNLLFASLQLSDSQFSQVLEQLRNENSNTFYASTFNHSNASKYVGSINNELSEALLISSQITPILTKGLNGNPRQCKRFLNMMLTRIEMAKHRSIELKMPTLGKLMLLEYFKPESFNKLAELQFVDEGKSEALQSIESYLKKNMETSEESTSTKKKSSVNEYKGELETWLSDKWLNQWLKINPQLSGIDLRPYFFFSRDRLRALPVIVQRMSKEAQELFTNLISESDTTRNKALQNVSTISSGDLASIFGAITNSIREQDEPNSIQRNIELLFLLSEKRDELTTELLEFIDSLSVNKISMQHIPRLQSLIDDRPAYKEKVISILEKWKQSDSSAISAAAESVIKDIYGNI